MTEDGVFLLLPEKAVCVESGKNPSRTINLCDKSRFGFPRGLSRRITSPYVRTYVFCVGLTDRKTKTCTVLK